MSAPTEQSKFRPFHETIVGAIRRCNPSPSAMEILHLFDLIKETKIPSGHSKIVAAIDEYFNFPGADKWAREIREVKESLLEQAQKVGEQTGNKVTDQAFAEIDQEG